ncbi:hypothetical protein HW260_11190 [Helicobacter cinaedi]|uniref:Uncharacterized protein n=1 Tax=Helicobacter cinaedi CCUG 18818 = ATCC BAA-847 TaxID=537971 RepID=A0ABN0B9X7_9HELI|nr:hypothetical protein [Helicobacter cinaedi]EFR45995.1 hypothetical protein HCCG_00541 [Helicobacter cinaedi CCUG 18818 = ATCC BAA-847]QOQ91964.1 hypothetical protein HW260_11190 [Helicobacter cinaedi]
MANCSLIESTLKFLIVVKNKLAPFKLKDSQTKGILLQNPLLESHTRNNQTLTPHSLES